MRTWPNSVERQKELLVARLSKTLEEYGIEGDPEQFVDKLVEMLHNTYPAYTVDELLLRPREALRFCDSVRQSINNYDVPDDVLLRPILNRRKQG
jgi:hypothetical protein